MNDLLNKHHRVQRQECSVILHIFHIFSGDGGDDGDVTHAHWAAPLTRYSAAEWNRPFCRGFARCTRSLSASASVSEPVAVCERRAGEEKTAEAWIRCDLCGAVS